MDFPGNSHASKIVNTEPEKSEETSDPKKVTPIVNGKVSVRKKPLGVRFKDMFVSDGGSFFEYLIEEHIVPALKDVVVNAVNQTINGVGQTVEQKLFGEVRSRPSSTRPGGSGGPVAYHRYGSSTARRSGSGPTNVRPMRSMRRSNIVEDIILDSREEGDMVIDELSEIIDRHGHCTVGDLYSLVGKKPRSTDEEWGWTDLRMANTNMLSRDEFLLNMPRPVPIDAGH